MNQTVPHRILAIDPENLFGELLAFVLKYYHNDTTQIVRSKDAGWVSLEAELANAVRIQLFMDGFMNTDRYNAILFVTFHLFGTAAVRLLDREPHRVGQPVSIHDHASIHMPRWRYINP